VNFEEIGQALKRVHEIAKKGSILRSNAISRADREILVKSGWLKPIIRGWYYLAKPETQPGDSTIWYSNFWEFIRVYLETHYGKNYCLSAKNSIDLHIKSPLVPKQLIAIISKSGGAPVQLPFDTSILAYGDPKNIPEERVQVEGIQIMELPFALCKVAPSFFTLDPQNAELALRQIRSAEELLPIIIKYKFRTAANRLIGAYRFLQDEEMANHLEKELKNFGFPIQPENPFDHLSPITPLTTHPPHKARIFAIWQKHRESVIHHFSGIVPSPLKKETFFAHLEEVYKQDAYNSLSIEGYKVDEELIERVINNEWNPDFNPEDNDRKNALAARGYYEAFQEVKKTIGKIFDGMNPGEAFKKDLSGWFGKLFGPSADAGIISHTDLIGYRRGQVYIRNSRHTPLEKEVLLDAMEALFECLKNESHPVVRAVLGHYVFVYIHPYMDGNGRIARFLMNAMFASGGYPWTIIHVKNREEYFKALEAAHVEDSCSQLTSFILKELKKGLSS
jgi:hypothetical protein